jgi:hypothetical protein
MHTGSPETRQKGVFRMTWRALIFLALLEGSPANMTSAHPQSSVEALLDLRAEPRKV